MTEIPQSVFAQMLAQIQNSLQFMEQSGCKGFECSEEALKRLKYMKIHTVKKKSQAIETLEKIREDLGDCKRCRLCNGRTNIVYGAGSPKARLVFVGEAPGADEDRSGQPFVGESGQLLSKIISAMNMTRDQVYICNIIKCRPPANRDPQPDEIQACLPFLNRQLAAIQPKIICALGRIASQTLLDKKTPISKLRGSFFEYQGIKLMPTFHPAYLLRNASAKREVWEDMKKIMKEMGIEPSK